MWGLYKESDENNLFKTTAKVAVTNYSEQMNTATPFMVVQPTFLPAKEVSEVSVSSQRENNFAWVKLHFYCFYLLSNFMVAL